MNHFLRENSNYDKRPLVPVTGHEQDCWEGWENISAELVKRCAELNRKKTIVIVEFYTGVFEEEIQKALIKNLQPHYSFSSDHAMKNAEEIDSMVYPDVTDDRVFGYLTRLHIESFFVNERSTAAQKQINEIEEGIILIYGTGATLLAQPDILIYADMPRWEEQLRFRRNEVSNLGVNNKELDAAQQYKRAFFVDWRVCDRLKKKLLNRWDYVLDTVIPAHPKMVTGNAMRNGLKQAATRPFRVVPFFDPGPWGGQWMKEVCDLDRSAVNYAWCFDCVPEENSLLLGFGNTTFETPAINLVFYQPAALLGEAVYARFGTEFPIRFDFLDTMQGGNLSLQVHPLTEYIQENFGMHYTQDESYYMLDAEENSVVYLGFKEEINAQQMLGDLRASQQNSEFDAAKYAEQWPVKKHDHFLIPAGTIHCSGAGGMVLEISATPYIFTFKLWDWGRLGLDGKPRPINIDRGEKVLQWNRTKSWVEKNLVNRVEKIAEGDGWTEERTGLHETEFIETRRHWFTGKVSHHTNGLVNVINLVEGREIVVESPDNAFEPFAVHYAETFIIPAAVGAYTIRPFGGSEGKKCATLKAFVRTKS